MTEFFNAGKWCGEVIAIEKDLKKGYNVQMKFLSVSERDGQTYEEILPFRLEDNDALLKLEEGKKASLNAIFNTFEITEKGETVQRTFLHVDPATVRPEKDNAKYVNFLLLEGEMRNFDFRLPTPTKQGFGICLMKAGEKIFRAMCFKNVMNRMQSVTRGSILQHGGPVRWRDFDDRITGQKRKMMELISQADWFQIKQTAVIENPLGEYLGYTPGETTANPDKKTDKKTAKK
jgi:hypothetical protein